MSSWRVIAGIVLVVALAGVLVWTQVGGGDESSNRSSPTVSPPSPTISSTTQPVPSPDLTGEDFPRIVGEIVSFLDLLSANPDPTRVDEVFHPRCSCFESRRSALEELQERGWHYATPRTEVLRVEEQTGVGQRNRVVLDVVLREGATDVVDSEGNVVESVEADPPTRFTMTLVRESPADPWRVGTLIRHGPVEGGG